MSVPQPGGGRRLQALKNAEDAKKFYAAVQDEISRLPLYSLEEEDAATCTARHPRELSLKQKLSTKLLEAVPHPIPSHTLLAWSTWLSMDA